MNHLLLFADGDVGEACVAWLLTHYREDVGLIVVKANSPIEALAQEAGVASLTYHTNEQVFAHIDALGLELDLGLLLWWPHIIRPPLIGLPKNGFVNTHPSLLPYNRGKHYNFWSLVDDTPFGVTLHLIDEGIDTGPILTQIPLEKSWEDTGETLHKRAKAAMIDLVKSSYPAMSKGQFTPQPQATNTGSFRRSQELEGASLIALDTPTTPRDLLNRLRARTFTGYPGCRFEENGRTFEVTVSIKDVT